MVTTPLVTLEEVKDQLRRPDEDTADMLRKCSAATAIVLSYLEIDDVALAQLGWTSATVPDDVKSAILVQVGELYAFRGDGDAPDHDRIQFASQPGRSVGDLSPQVTRYIYRRRNLVIS